METDKRIKLVDKLMMLFYFNPTIWRKNVG